MGRLPDTFAGRPISYRVPYVLSGELTLAIGGTGTQFPDATFLHNGDKPFEIHRIIPRLTGLIASGALMTPQPAAGLLERLTRIRVYDSSKNENLTKNAQLFTTWTKNNELTWEWIEPYTLVRSEGFSVSCDNNATLAIVTNFYNATRVELAFEGFLIVVAPPSENR